MDAGSSKSAEPPVRIFFGTFVYFVPDIDRLLYFAALDSQASDGNVGCGTQANE